MTSILRIHPFPEIHPLLNFETIRCELRRHCLDVESSLDQCLERCRQQASATTQQRLDERFEELLSSMRWLRERIRTYHPAKAISRSDWMWLVEEVGRQVQAVRGRAESILDELSIQPDVAQPDKPHPPLDGIHQSPSGDRSAEHARDASGRSHWNFEVESISHELYCT